MTLSKQAVRQAPLDKGFREEVGRHRKFILYYEGRKTGVFTMLSHGGPKELSGWLLSAIRKQLLMDNLQQLSDFVRCPMTYDDYIAILKSKGVLK